MKQIISVIIWIIGTIYLVLFVFLLIFISYIFKRKTYDPFIKMIARFLFKIIFIIVKLEGLENIDKNAVYTIMGNHVSMFDIPLMFGFMPIPFNGIEASEHFKTPFYGWSLRRYGNIPMNRHNPRESLKSILKGVDLIKHGTSIVILPEGTRTLEPKLGTFKKFPFVMAQKAEVPILPFAFSGLWKVNNKTTWLIRPGKIIIRFGKPISTETILSTKVDDLMVLTHEKIQGLISEP